MPKIAPTVLRADKTILFPNVGGVARTFGRMTSYMEANFDDISRRFGRRGSRDTAFVMTTTPTKIEIYVHPYAYYSTSEDLVELRPDHGLIFSRTDSGQNGSSITNSIIIGDAEVQMLNRGSIVGHYYTDTQWSSGGRTINETDTKKGVSLLGLFLHPNDSGSFSFGAAFNKDEIAETCKNWFGFMSILKNAEWKTLLATAEPIEVLETTLRSFRRDYGNGGPEY